jgi:hypothetical protein
MMCIRREKKNERKVPMTSTRSYTRQEDESIPYELPPNKMFISILHRIVNEIFVH